MLTKEILQKLAESFPPEAIQWRPGQVGQSKAQALPFVDLRYYIERLNMVTGGDWSDNYEIFNGGSLIVCRLTICGVTRCGVGEAEPEDRNTVTSAVAQAFKRACVKFGLGLYVYRLPTPWVPYDETRKTFTQEGWQILRKVARTGGLPARIGKNKCAKKTAFGRADVPIEEELHNGNEGDASLTPSLSDRKATPTDFWLKARREVMPRGVPSEAVQRVAKEAARTGDWNTAMKKLDELLSRTRQ